MRDQCPGIGGEEQPKRRETFFPGFRTVVVLVRTGETTEQAWRRHVKQHPEDKPRTNIRIFHVASQAAS
jgi:hypothetical protein